jgi:hypothetical protein
MACALLLVKAKGHLHRPEIMDSFSPELAQHWLASQSSNVDNAVVDRRAEESLTPSQQAALDALADRISAARSVY